MKKITSVLMAIALLASSALALSSCGDDAKTPAADKNNAAKTEAATTADGDGVIKITMPDDGLFTGNEEPEEPTLNDLTPKNEQPKVVNFNADMDEAHGSKTISIYYYESTGAVCVIYADYDITPENPDCESIKLATPATVDQVDDMKDPQATAFYTEDADGTVRFDFEFGKLTADDRAARVAAAATTFGFTANAEDTAFYYEDVVKTLTDMGFVIVK